MNPESKPIVGQWYRLGSEPQMVQVVAVDEGDDTVDVQYFDGTLDELPLASWSLQAGEACASPQDWTGPFDDIERDDLGATETDMSPEDWHEPYEGTPEGEEAGHDGAAAAEAAQPPVELAQDVLDPEAFEHVPASEQLYARPTPKGSRTRPRA